MSTPIDTNIQVSHRGSNYSITLPSDDTLAGLKSSIAELTNVPPTNQKLIYKGKKASHGDDTTLANAGFKDVFRLQMLGNTDEELGGLRKVEDEQKRVERIMQERQAKGTVKVRSTGSSSSAALKYRFHRIEPLPHLPNPSSALSFLQRLSSDPAIKHVMQTNQLEVGLLTELAPHEHPDLLGLNVNAGQAIKLRIRTNAYDGFRLYADVRKVLCHELTHNVWGNHDDDFKEMNSRLNREVIAYEQAAKAATHTLGGSYLVYESSSELELEAAHILGGSGMASSAHETPEDRRRKILNATMSRLRKEEEELEQSCGTAGPAREQDQETA